MSNTIKFINKYIRLLKQKIESSKEAARLYYANSDWEFGEMEEENRVGYEEELELFKQIKTELEAWYIIKNALELTENELGEEEIDMKVFFTNAKVEVCDTRKEFKKLKKALEVEK